MFGSVVLVILPMGRRALRRIDPALDLSRHYRDAAELPAEFDQVALFGRVQLLEVEVGSGKGLFLTGAARPRPDHNFVGIEIARKYARFAAARASSRCFALSIYRSKRKISTITNMPIELARCRWFTYTTWVHIPQSSPR